MMSDNGRTVERGLEVTPKEAQAWLAASPAPRVIDVREPQEFTFACLENSELVPMQDVPQELQRLEALSDKTDLLFVCHHGVRSLQVVHWLREQGLENCFSLAGGLDQWSREVDPNIPRY